MLLLFVISCGEKPKIDEESYVNILTELEIIHVLDRNIDDDEYIKALIDSIWSNYKVTPEIFKQSHEIYSRDMKAQIDRYLKVENNLLDVHNKLNERIIEYREERMVREAEKLHRNM